ncbi:hypothetical protein SAMN05421812_10756 [Asanoa hainanensis]|uniref:Uncharacterized protein n=1 Tax=Asanoa hainanensis TaxID=560556 RepID=A0A239N1P3_9ACTN|nr:hypothetical protein SAMN05421812_10756 [Asanoa hainanensis]
MGRAWTVPSPAEGCCGESRRRVRWWLPAGPSDPTRPVRRGRPRRSELPRAPSPGFRAGAGEQVRRPGPHLQRRGALVARRCGAHRRDPAGADPSHVRRRVPRRGALHAERRGRARRPLRVRLRDVGPQVELDDEQAPRPGHERPPHLRHPLGDLQRAGPGPGQPGSHAEPDPGYEHGGRGPGPDRLAGAPGERAAHRSAIRHRVRVQGGLWKCGRCRDPGRPAGHAGRGRVDADLELDGARRRDLPGLRDLDPGYVSGVDPGGGAELRHQLLRRARRGGAQGVLGGALPGRSRAAAQDPARRRAAVHGLARDHPRLVRNHVVGRGHGRGVPQAQGLRHHALRFPHVGPASGQRRLQRVHRSRQGDLRPRR